MLTYDSSANGHYLSKADCISTGLCILRPSAKHVGVANGSISVGKHATALPFPLLSHTATSADSFDDFPTPLMSVGKTADDGTISIFTKDGVTIHKETDVLITCHAPFGWPLFTIKNVQKYYPDSAETHKGHLNQTCKNVRSTKPMPPPFEEVHSNQLGGRKVHDIYTKTYQVRDTIFTDQTGQFPTRSQGDNKYIMVMVEIDSSIILVEPIKNRTDAELTRAYSALMLRLRRAGIIPCKHVLNNEISKAMKDLIQDTYKMTLELVTSGCHHRNAAKVAIRNFKSHFLSILAGVADDFLLKLWDKLLPQTEIILNRLRQSNATPTVSAYTHLNGPYDYNKMSLATMGCNAQVHEKTDSQGTWAFHSVDRWYINTSPEHYRTHHCHIKSTNSECLGDTIQFCHKHITNPSLTPADKLMAAIADCSHALLTHTPAKGTSTIRQLQALLQQTSTQLNSSSHCLSHQSIRTLEHPLPKVEHALPRLVDLSMLVTRSTTPVIPDVPTQTTPRTPRLITHRRHHTPPQHISLPTDTPARNTRSQTAATTKLAAPPAHNTRPCTSCIPKPTTITHTKSSLLAQLKNEVHKALAVLDKSMGKLLNYRQLLRRPVYQGDWTISLLTSLDAWHKGSADASRALTLSNSSANLIFHRTAAKMSHTGILSATYALKKPNPTARASLIISTPGAKFMTMDLSNFYLMTPGPRPEYLRLKLSDISTEIITEYRLDLLAEPDGTIYVLVRLGMYSSLPMSSLKNGSTPMDTIKATLQEHYKVTTDWNVSRYGAFLNIAHIIKHVMASTTEAKLAALYIMAREAVFIRIILEELGHKQPATPLQTDNSTAEGVVNGKVQPKHMKATDMQFHWLHNHKCQEQFRIYWRPGKLNYTDYWTKHHPAAHHQNILREFIT
eukprot:CCRYP_018472-RA/>CCRYP_018472-RA protein AED:0.06 eAED:0.06 QI:0/0/0/1/1/1/4/0/898